MSSKSAKNYLDNFVDINRHDEAAAAETFKAIWKSRTFIDAVFESIRDGICVLDTNLRIIHTNRLMKEWYRPKLPLEGQACFSCYHNATKPCTPCPSLKCLESGKTEWGVARGLPGTSIEWVEIYSFPMKHPGTERVNGVVELVRDITEKKRAEIALAKSEKKYREIFNATNDAIFIHDAETGKVLDVNKKMLYMYGWKAEDVKGLDVEDFSSCEKPYTRERAIKKIKKAIVEGPQIFEWQAKKKNGDFFWVEVNLRFSKIDENESIIAVVRDITERKQHHELIVHSEKMLSLGGLAAGIAHEIKAPLAGIVHNTSVLWNRLTNKTIPANRQAAQDAGTSMEKISSFMEERQIPRIINAITKSGKRMDGIINNMLSFSRKSEDAFSVHEPAGILDNALELAAMDFSVTRHYDLKSIAIEKQYGPNLPQIVCDSSKIQQVLMNILINGVHAMSTASKLDTPKFILRLNHEADVNMLRIEIQDNGPGMDKQTSKKIFEPFFTTKPTGIGTGLGLFISYLIVTQNHKGSMDVISAPGKGANFILRLPANTNPDQE